MNSLFHRNADRGRFESSNWYVCAVLFVDELKQSCVCSPTFCLCSVFLVDRVTAFLFTESETCDAFTERRLELLSQSALLLPALLITAFPSCRISPAGNTSLVLASVSVCEIDAEGGIIWVNHSWPTSTDLIVLPPLLLVFFLSLPFIPPPPSFCRSSRYQPELS